MALTPELIESLQEGALCLTGGSRLARFLARSYGQAQQARGLSRWPTPQVMTLPAWLDRCAATLAFTTSPDPAVWLNDRQESVLWRQVIESSPRGSLILNLEQAAGQAAATWAAAAGWQLPLRDPAWELLEDTATFREWAREFYRRCRRTGVRSRAQLPEAVVGAIENGSLNVPRAVYLAGLLDRTPSTRALLGALAKAGCRIVEYDPPPAGEAEPSYRSYPSPHEEMRAAVSWAHDRLLENPERRLAIIVPDLTAQRDRWEATLAGAFRASNAATVPYHLSLGRPLASAGIIRAALQLTGLIESKVPLETASALLLTPYLGGSREERLMRAAHALELRKRGGSAVPLLQLAAATTPLLSSLLIEWDAIRRELPAEQTPSRWARQFSQLLRRFGWPAVELDSAEYQATESLRDALSELASLDAVTGPVGAREAAAHLTTIVHSKVFQLEDLGQPLQVVGAREALGERFDAVWLAGFHDRAWPPPGQPLALAPVSLQRAARMPRAVPQLWLDQYSVATATLLESAPGIVITHPRVDGEEPLLPSPLFRGVFRAEAALPPGALRRAPTELVADWQGPAYRSSDAHGGAGLLRDQSHCPFRSFAVHRLDAREFPEAELGLSVQERGIVLHAAIDNCWRRLRDLATLRATPNDELASIIHLSVRRAIQDCTESLAEPFDVQVREVEQRRLERLLALWMEVERRREANFTVIGSESRRSMELDGLRLTTRFDRQDQLDDGRLVLIDYKSNAPSPAAWDGSRPEEPQIPLYAISTEKPVAAVAFGQLKRSEARFKGAADDAGILPNVKPGETPLAGRVAAWRPVLENLAAQYRSGFAPVDPKNSGTCERCHLPALCRIHEAPPRNEEDDDAGD